jgi:hypothetical protein
MEKKNVLRLIIALVFIAISFFWQIVCLIFEITWKINLWVQIPFFIIMLIIFIFSGVFIGENRQRDEEDTKYLTEYEAQEYLQIKYSRDTNNPTKLQWHTVSIKGTVNDPQSKARVYYCNPKDHYGKRHLIAIRIDGQNFKTQSAEQVVMDNLTMEEQIRILEYRSNKLFPSPEQSGFETEEYLDPISGGVIRRKKTRNIIQKKPEETLAPDKKEEKGEEK